MRAGTLNRKITIQRRVTGVDPIGQPIDTTEDIATVWANIRHTSGLEAIKGGAETSIVKASIRIRYRADIDASMTVLHGSKVYQIKAVLPDEAGRDYLDLVCEEIDGGL